MSKHIERGDKSLNTWLPPEFCETVDRAARSQGVSRAAFLRQALVSAVLPGDTDG